MPCLQLIILVMGCLRNKIAYLRFTSYWSYEGQRGTFGIDILNWKYGFAFYFFFQSVWFLPSVFIYFTKFLLFVCPTKMNFSV